MTSDDYQRYFENAVAPCCTPMAVEGRAGERGPEYRVAARKRAPGEYWWSHHSLDRSSFQTANLRHQNDGLSLVWMQSFVDQAGMERTQGIWIRK
jgi:hypothetical protein